MALPRSIGRTRINYRALSPTELEKRGEALDVIALMRKNRRLTLTQAAKIVGIKPKDVLHYGGSAFSKRHGRYCVRDYDRLRRDLYLYDWNGKFTVVTHSSKTASTIARYHNAVRAFINHGDESALREFDGMSVTIGGKRFEFLTDRRRLRELARAGELRFDEIYPGARP